MALADDVKGLDLASLTLAGPYCVMGEEMEGLDFAGLSFAGPFYGTPSGGAEPPAAPGVLTRVYPGLVRFYPGLGRVLPL